MKIPPRKSNSGEVRRLQRRIKQLEKDFDYLDEKLSKVVAHFTRQGIELCELGTDICEDLRQLQHKVFPNLARDLARAHKIVPFTDARTPDALDRRPKKSK